MENEMDRILNNNKKSVFIASAYPVNENEYSKSLLFIKGLNYKGCDSKCGSIYLINHGYYSSNDSTTLI